MSALVIAARVNLLVQVADHRARREGFDPHVAVIAHAEQWDHATEADHRELAREAGMKLDPRAARQFVEALWGRAERTKGRAA